jgi:5-hydroxyisourate hydrolase
MSRLSTHVLDTANGRPAEAVALVLSRIGPDGSRTVLVKTRTDRDGRTARPLLEGEDFQVGTYEIAFAMGDYFRGLGTAMPEPPFVDVVPLRFGVADIASHYHVPLLASPWSFSTYRGS